MGLQGGMRKERRGETRSKGIGRGGGGGSRGGMMMNAGTGLAIGVVAVVGMGLMSKFVSRLRPKPPKDPDVKVVEDIVNGEPAKNQSVQAQAQAEKLLMEAAHNEGENKRKKPIVAHNDDDDNDDNDDDHHHAAAENKDDSDADAHAHAHDDVVDYPTEIGPGNMAPSSSSPDDGSPIEGKEFSYAPIKPVLPSAAYESSSGLRLDPGKQEDGDSGFDNCGGGAAAHGRVETLDRAGPANSANEPADEMSVANVPTKEFTTGTRVSSHTGNEGSSSTNSEEAVNSSSKGESSECTPSGRPRRPHRQSSSSQAGSGEPPPPGSQIPTTESAESLSTNLDDKSKLLMSSTESTLPTSESTDIEESTGIIGETKARHAAEDTRYPLTFAEDSDSLNKKESVIEEKKPETTAAAAGFERVVDERANLVVETAKAAQELWNGRDLSREGGIAQLLDGKEEAACLQLKSSVASSICRPRETAKEEGIVVEEVVKRSTTLLARPAAANGSAGSLVYKIEETCNGLTVEEVLRRPKLLLPLPAEGDDFALSDKQVLETRNLRTSRKQRCGGVLKMLPVQLQIIAILLVFMSIIYILLWRHQNLLLTG